MAQKYADRAQLNLNGNFLYDLQNVTFRRSDGTRYVPTMTANKANAGYVSGNREITVSFSVAVQNKLGTPKIEALDFENNNVSLTYAQGGDRYTLSNGILVDVEQSAPGVGSEGKKSFSMLFLTAVDQVGNSSLFSG